MAESEERDLQETERRFEREADELQKDSEKLGEHIDETRQDWERKQADRNVEGAVSPEDTSDDVEDTSGDPDPGGGGDAAG